MTNKEIEHRLEELDRKENKILFEGTTLSPDDYISLAKIKEEKAGVKEWHTPISWLRKKA